MNPPSFAPISILPRVMMPLSIGQDDAGDDDDCHHGSNSRDNGEEGATGKVLHKLLRIRGMPNSQKNMQQLDWNSPHHNLLVDSYWILCNHYSIIGSQKTVYHTIPYLLPQRYPPQAASDGQSYVTERHLLQSRTCLNLELIHRVPC